jgi:hypothetical protein
MATAVHIRRRLAILKSSTLRLMSSMTGQWERNEVETLMRFGVTYVRD